MKSEISKKISEIKNNPNVNRFYKETISYDYLDFTNKLKSSEFVLSCIDKLSLGTIFVLKNSIDENFIEYAKNTLTKISKDELEIDSKVLDGCKNGFYNAKNLNEDGYKTFDKSFYFYHWNDDKTGIFDKIYSLYKPLKILNGNNENDLIENIPSDGHVERLHVINYPIGGGQISKHYDPISISICNFGLYGTKNGVDYDEGGFFVLNKDNEEVNLDKDIEKTDIVLFFPGLIHGVNPINAKMNSENKGRWFFNINTIESHHNLEREFTVAIK